MKHKYDNRGNVWIVMGLLFALSVGAVAADPPAYQPAPGYRMSVLGVNGSAFALSPGRPFGGGSRCGRRRGDDRDL